jgi:predicted RNA-binding Zn ribbon-like protein
MRLEPSDLAALVNEIRAALAEIVNRTGIAATVRLLAAYPPDMNLSDHDGAGAPHIHFARNGMSGQPWIGQTVAATLAHVVAGDPALTLGRRAACPNFFVDQSRNRTRRFCSNTCASRTTVAAYRARQQG